MTDRIGYGNAVFTVICGSDTVGAAGTSGRNLKYTTNPDPPLIADIIKCLN